MRASLAAFVFILAGLGCGGTEPRFPEPTGPAVARVSSKNERKSVALTVYNQGMSVVREVRDVTLAEGRVELEWKDVSAQVMPQTVHIRSLSDPAGLRVLEQNYRYDLLGPQKLLDKYVGKKIKVYRWNEAKGVDEAKEAEVLAVKNGLVLKIDNEVTFGYPGRLAFPEVPKNLIDKPTLVWLLASRAPKAEMEVSYLSSGLSWSADYVLVVDDKDARGDLTGWVTLANQSGASFEDATLKLVAGDVNQVKAEEQLDYNETPRVQAASPPAPPFREESFFEYHLYTLDRATTVRDNEQKQVTLLEGRGAKIQKKLIFRGREQYFMNTFGEPLADDKVSVYLEIQNAKENALGMPLPRGVIRVYKADKSGSKQFIGEDHIDHTPRDEKIRVKTGDAFDIVGERKQMDFDALGTCQSESAWEIELRNHKDEDVEVEVREPASGDWEIVSESQKHKKEDARTFSYTVKIPARKSTKISYKVRVRWC